MFRKFIKSGFELLPQIPENWEIYKNKWIYKKQKTIVGRDFNNFQLLSLTKDGIKEIDVTDNIGKRPNDYGTYQKVNVGDLILCLYDLDVSAVFVGYAKYSGIISPSYLNLQSNSKIYNKYSYYWFLMNFYDRRYKIFSKSIRYTINNDNFMSLQSPVPPYDEQQSIANFLDDKTAKIDELINLQETSIEKLDVFKEALIRKYVSNYVYHKGDIDSIVYNKESLRIDSICKIIRGNSAFTKKDLLNDGDFVGLQYGKTYKVDTVDINYNVYVKSSFYKESQVCKNGNTIIISTSETMEDLGHTCFYSREDLGLLGGEQMMLIPNQETISEKFLYYLSIVFTKKLRRHATGLKVFRFSTQHLKNIFFNLPSKEIQYKIVKILDEKIPKIIQLIQLKKDKIDKLNEYKKSLIYEAVTGKIEVCK